MASLKVSLLPLHATNLSISIRGDVSLNRIWRDGFYLPGRILYVRGKEIIIDGNFD
jgi:hypothetical protein